MFTPCKGSMKMLSVNKKDLITTIFTTCICWYSDIGWWTSQIFWRRHSLTSQTVHFSSTIKVPHDHRTLASNRTLNHRTFVQTIGNYRHHRILKYYKYNTGTVCRRNASKTVHQNSWNFVCMKDILWRCTFTGFFFLGGWGRDKIYYWNSLSAQVPCTRLTKLNVTI